MLGVTGLATYTLGALIIVLLPGPNSIYVLSVAARKGIRTGYRAAAGVFLGDFTLITLTSLGAASLLKANPEAFAVVGVRRRGVPALDRLRHAPRRPLPLARTPRRRRAGAGTDPGAGGRRRAPVPPGAGDQPAATPRRSSSCSPSSPSSSTPTTACRPSPSLLGGILQAMSFLYLSTLIFAGTRLAAAFRRRRALSAGLTSAVALLFAGFAAKLAASSA